MANAMDDFEFEGQLNDAIDRAGVGEFDGSSVDPDAFTVEYFMYGPDADALWAAVEPIVRPVAAEGSTAVKRYGAPGAREVKIVLP